MLWINELHLFGYILKRSTNNYTHLGVIVESFVIFMSDSLPLFIKDMRKKFGLTQVDLAAKSGVGLRFVRELEQGKETLRMDKVNQVLALFGHKVGAVPIRKEDEE